MKTKVVQKASITFGAIIVTAMAAFHGVIAENLAALVAEDRQSRVIFALIGLIGFAMMTALFWKREDFEQYLLRGNGKSHAIKPILWNRATSLALLVVSLLALAQGMLALNFAHWFSGLLHHNSKLLIGIGVFMFFGGTLTLWKLRDSLLMIRDKLADERAASTKHAAIIMVLSAEDTRLPDSERFPLALNLFGNAVTKKPTSESWQAGIDALTSATPDPSIGRWNVQQPLRALKWLVSESTPEMPLHQIDVICSEKSWPRYNQLAGLMNAIITAHPEEHVNAIKLAQRDERLVENKLQDNYDTFKSILNELESKHLGRTVTVDITGGTADFSVAAAMATLSRRVKFSYINTNNCEPIDFDVYAFAVGMAAD
jgi:CRISPR-associated protein (Cas_Cas02710)